MPLCHRGGLSPRRHYPDRTMRGRPTTHFSSSVKADSFYWSHWQTAAMRTAARRCACAFARGCSTMNNGRAGRGLSAPSPCLPEYPTLDRRRYAKDESLVLCDIWWQCACAPHPFRLWMDAHCMSPVSLTFDFGTWRNILFFLKVL